MNHRIPLALALLAALAACGEKANLEAAAQASPSPSAGAAPDAGNTQPLAPAIIPPDEVADPTEPPSYEVAVATAAANRNGALARCAKQPEAVRTQCEQEANAAFADAETQLQDLRGNQE